MKKLVSNTLGLAFLTLILLVSACAHQEPVTVENESDDIMEVASEAGKPGETEEAVTVASNEAFASGEELEAEDLNATGEDGQPFEVVKSPEDAVEVAEAPADSSPALLVARVDTGSTPPPSQSKPESDLSRNIQSVRSTEGASAPTTEKTPPKEEPKPSAAPSEPTDTVMVAPENAVASADEAPLKGEEEKPQYASVEIANFMKRHWPLFVFGMLVCTWMVLSIAKRRRSKDLI